MATNTMTRSANRKTGMLILAVLFSVGLPSSAADEATNQSTPDEIKVIQKAPVGRVLRPMQVHKEDDMGLEIWIENEPAWIAAKKTVNGRPTFITQSPLNAYPPASMSVSSFNKLVNSDQDDFNEYAAIALKQGLIQFDVKPELHNAIVREPKQYGGLLGIEINFSTQVHDAPADVKIFIGRGENQNPVLLQIFTLEGSMEHLSEHVRRSWGNIRYL